MSEQINHPEHYQSDSMEVIEIIDAYQLNFYEGNVIKYLLRHSRKGGINDLKKAKWYLDRLIERIEKDSK